MYVPEATPVPLFPCVPEVVNSVKNEGLTPMPALAMSHIPSTLHWFFAIWIKPAGDA